MKSLPYLVGGMVLSAVLGRSALAEPAKLKPLSEADVLKLVELSIEDEAVVHRLKAGGVNFTVDGEVIAHLRKAGASEKILAALKGDFSPAVAPADKVIASGKQGGPEDKPAEKVIASGTLDSGVVLEVTNIKRTTDGFLMVNFRYRNPTKRAVQVADGSFSLGTSAAYHLIDGIHYVDPASKQVYGIVKVGVVPASSKVFGGDGIKPPAEGATNLWVKMAAPDDDKVEKVTFYFGNLEPLEDVPLPPAKK